MITVSLLFSTLALSVRADARTADWIRLDDGRTLTGRVVYEDPRAVHIRRGRGGDVAVERAHVVELGTRERSLDELLDRCDPARLRDASALAELARFSEERGLEHEARALWLRLLRIDPTHELAMRGFGAHRNGGKTRVRLDRRFVDLAAYSAEKSRWQDAIEIRTTHFQIRTDVALDRVLDLALSLERHYLRFYDFLGAELALYVFDEVPEIRVYAHEEDFPPAWRAGARSWFAPAENVLHVLASDDLDLAQAIHDGTDMLLFNAARRSSGATVNLPPWAAEGLAQYFAATAGRTPKDAWTPLGTPSRALFREAARDDGDEVTPATLETVLRSSAHELRGGVDAQHRSAVAYALVHYLLHADGGAHRDLFFSLLREAARGKSIEERVIHAFLDRSASLQSAVLAHARTQSL